ncbi:MAG: hypothetical protein ACREKH_13400, partial [Candidatus Rokuibacteriota bacterium]
VRLILRAVLSTPGFDDPYAMTKSAQVDLVLRAIHSVRPDVPRAIVEDALEEPERAAGGAKGRSKGRARAPSSRPSAR